MRRVAQEKNDELTELMRRMEADDFLTVPQLEGSLSVDGEAEGASSSTQKVDDEDATTQGSVEKDDRVRADSGGTSCSRPQTPPGGLSSDACVFAPPPAAVHTPPAPAATVASVLMAPQAAQVPQAQAPPQMALAPLVTSARRQAASLAGLSQTSRSSCDAASASVPVAESMPPAQTPPATPPATQMPAATQMPPEIALTIGSWIADLRSAVSDCQKDVMLVVGNEASDADSIISALAYGFLRHCQSPGDLLVVPVIQCAREDIVLRRETELLLSLCGVDSGDLIFLSDSGTDLLLDCVNQVILVDHNKATGPIAALGDCVVEIVDHHRDIGAHEAVSGDDRCIAFEGGRATAGSCCSLITEAYLVSAFGQELLARDGGAVAQALLGVICIDTHNLDEAAGKSRPQDSAAVAELAKVAHVPCREQLHAQLEAAKFDADLWLGLTAQQCLRYDYKAFREENWSYGLSAVLCSVEVLAAKAAWLEDASRRASELDLFGVLTQVRLAGGGAVRRQLLLFSVDVALAAAAAAFALAYTSPSLELEPIAITGPPGLHAFEQRNAGASRKQVQPCLAEFFQGWCPEQPPAQASSPFSAVEVKESEPPVSDDFESGGNANCLTPQVHENINSSMYAHTGSEIVRLSEVASSRKSGDGPAGTYQEMVLGEVVDVAEPKVAADPGWEHASEMSLIAPQQQRRSIISRRESAKQLKRCSIVTFELNSDEAALSSEVGILSDSASTNSSKLHSNLPMLHVSRAATALRVLSPAEIRLVDIVMRLGDEAVEEHGSISNGRPPSTHRAPVASRSARHSTVHQRLSAALVKNSNAETPNDNDVVCAVRLFHASVPASFASLKAVRRVTSAQLYSRFRNSVAAECGCEVCFYAPPDTTRLARLQEQGLGDADLEDTPHGRGMPVFAFAAAACRRARDLQRPKGGHPLVMCVLLCCPGRIGPEAGTRADRNVNPSEYCFVKPARLYFFHELHFVLRDAGPEASAPTGPLALKLREAETEAAERHGTARALWEQYQAAGGRLCAAVFARCQAAYGLREHAAHGASRCLVALGEGSEEGEAAVALFLLAGGAEAADAAAASGQRGRGGASSHEGPWGDARGFSVHRVEHSRLFWDFCAQPGAAIEPQGLTHLRRSSARRVTEQVAWHTLRVRKDDGEGSSLDQRVWTIFERSAKGASAQNGTWVAVAPVVSGATSHEGQVAFVLCAAKALQPELVGTSWLRIRHHDRLLPMYVIMYGT